LLDPVDASKEEAHAKDKEQVRKHATDQGSFDNGNLALDQS